MDTEEVSTTRVTSIKTDPAPASGVPPEPSPPSPAGAEMGSPVPGEAAPQRRHPPVSHNRSPEAHKFRLDQRALRRLEREERQRTLEATRRGPIIRTDRAHRVTRWTRRRPSRGARKTPRKGFTLALAKSHHRQLIMTARNVTGPEQLRLQGSPQHQPSPMPRPDALRIAKASESQGSS